jgi:hypothetical protein
MNMHSHMRIENNAKHVVPEKQQPKAGLWKLLVAAALILAGLVAAIELFGGTNSNFAAQHPELTTLVE